MNDIIPFDFEGANVRVVDQDGGPWFVAKDVAEALGIRWDGAGTVGHVPEEWKGVGSVPTPGGKQELLTISEQGLYFFLGRSDKPKALPFQKWIAGDVLPTIRKTGGYSKPPGRIEPVNDLEGVISHRMMTLMKTNPPDQAHILIQEWASDLARKITELSNATLQFISAKSNLERLIPPVTESRGKQKYTSNADLLSVDCDPATQNYIHIFVQTGNASKAYREAFQFHGSKQALVARATRLREKLIARGFLLP
jgi:prophage antirepressor-like protein